MIIVLFVIMVKNLVLVYDLVSIDFVVMLMMFN